MITVADHPEYGYAAAWSILAEGEFRDAERADKERLLGLAVSRIPKGLERESRVLTGDPAARLTEASGEFDLMVVGSRAWGPLKRTLLGSTTRKLIRSCACPVLVLPRGAGVDPLGVRSPPATIVAPRRRWRGDLARRRVVRPLRSDYVAGPVVVPDPPAPAERVRGMNSTANTKSVRARLEDR